jgi:hypothetical protein
MPRPSVAWEEALNEKFVAQKDQKQRNTVYFEVLLSFTFDFTVAFLKVIWFQITVILRVSMGSLSTLTCFWEE